MARVTVSPKYQVVIPKEIRKNMAVRPGQRLEVFFVDGKIEMVPVSHPKDLKGFVKGMKTGISREEKDRV